TSGTKLVEELSKPMSSDDEKTTSKNATTDTSNSDKLVAFKPGLDKQHQEVSDDSDVENEEHVYKETIADNGDVQKLVYKAAPTLVNVTLRSAINAGKFDDRGKVNSMDDCIKMCGQAGDCDVAFMLSSQCFTVHCFSEESCQNKPAFSDFYQPQLAYVKHRVINRHKNTTFGRTSFPDKPCPVKTELSNVTFIEGINSGNFTDMGHVATFDQCKQKCCENTGCNIAFKIQEDCYGVACHSRESCRTRPAKNANIFSPEMALMRSVHETLEQSVSEALDFVKDTVAELTFDQDRVIRPLKALYKGLGDINEP
uniref:MANSC domain-containing protein n=1 Tax=Clytia hemisphaerica TaxID=252671 RepID=A0A7M6DP15_9CNID